MKGNLKENLIQSDTSNNRLEVGDILRIGYMVYEGNKERTQYYEGVVIAIQNKGLGKVLQSVEQFKEYWY